MMSKIITGAVAGLVIVLAGAIVALPLVAWGTKDAPAFYGAFTAAIVAAIAVVLGSYYQFWLGNRRDRQLQDQAQISAAIDLSLWLQHAIAEMGFIKLALQEVERIAVARNEQDKPFSPLQFQQVITAQFFSDLQSRARDAAKLPPALARTISKVLYDTFSMTDRIMNLRGAASSFSPNFEQLRVYVHLIEVRTSELQSAAETIDDWLSQHVVVPDKPD